MTSPLLSKIYNSDLRASRWWWRHTCSLETLPAGILRGCTWVDWWKQIRSSRGFIWAFTLGSRRYQRERLRERGPWQGNNAWMCAESIRQISLVSSVEFFISHFPCPQNDLTIFFTKGCLWLDVALEYDTLRKALHIIANLCFSQIYQVKEVTWKLWSLPPQWSPTHLPHPQRTIEEIACTIYLPADFSPSSKISPSWYLLQKGVKRVCFEFDLCFGFCSKPLEPNKMTHTTVPRAKRLQKCVLPENSQLYQVWDFSCIPWCFGIVWFHHLSPTLPNFYQTRQEAGTLYSVCTVALSKTSLFSFFANVSGKGINMLCAKWITAN